MEKAIKIIISEPWDFVSPEGDNKLIGSIHSLLNSTDGRERFIIRVQVPFLYNNYIIDYLVATKRHNEDTKQYNFHYSPNELANANSFEKIKDKLDFILIGSIDYI